MDTELLAKIPLFAQLTTEDLAGLATLLERRDLSPYQTLFWIGDHGSDMCIIHSGQVEIVQPDEQGREIRLNTIGAGAFFGELSLLDGGPRTATVRTICDTVLLKLGRAEFLEFLTKHPSTAIHMLSEMGKRQREMLQMLRSVKNVNQVIKEQQTAGQKFADAFARSMGSWAFIICQVTIMVSWVVISVALLPPTELTDPFPFNLLNLCLASVAGIAGPIIMMSQQRQSEQDRIKAELEYQVNVKAHHEVMQLHKKIDQLKELVSGPRAAEPAPPVDTLHAPGEHSIAISAPSRNA
jgi:CRP/FNR family transcriptional regulator, cyclic AMP receptor protein